MGVVRAPKEWHLICYHDTLSVLLQHNEGATATPWSASVTYYLAPPLVEYNHAGGHSNLC